MSKFSGLIKAVQQEKAAATDAETAQTEAEIAPPPRKAKAAARPKAATAPAAKNKATPKARTARTATKKKPSPRVEPAEMASGKAEAPSGRADTKKTRRVGRSADSNYSKSTMYIHQEVHQDVKRALIGTGRDYSELVEDLLREWLKTNG